MTCSNCDLLGRTVERQAREFAASLAEAEKLRSLLRRLLLAYDADAGEPPPEHEELIGNIRRMVL